MGREGETGPYFRRAVPQRGTSQRQSARPIDRVCTCVAYLHAQVFQVNPIVGGHVSCTFVALSATCTYSLSLPLFGRRKKDPEGRTKSLKYRVDLF